MTWNFLNNNHKVTLAVILFSVNIIFIIWLFDCLQSSYIKKIKLSISSMIWIYNISAQNIFHENSKYFINP